MVHWVFYQRLCVCAVVVLSARESHTIIDQILDQHYQSIINDRYYSYKHTSATTMIGTNKNPIQITTSPGLRGIIKVLNFLKIYLRKHKNDFLYVGKEHEDILNHHQLPTFVLKHMTCNPNSQQHTDSPWLYAGTYNITRDKNLFGYIGTYLLRFDFMGENGSVEKGIYVGSSLCEEGLGRRIRNHFCESRRKESKSQLYEKLPTDINSVDIRILNLIKMADIYQTFGDNVNPRVVLDVIETLFIVRMDSYRQPAYQQLYFQQPTIADAKKEANFSWNVEKATGFNSKLELCVKRVYTQSILLPSGMYSTIG